MKPFHSFLMLAAIAAVGQAYADPVEAVTTPVGYVTNTLKPGINNLVGLTVQSPTLAAGVISGVTSDSVTADGVDFSTLLTSGQTYILEISNESGSVQEVTAWSGSTLTTVDDLSSVITAGTTAFKIRKAPTISELFGANTPGFAFSTDGSTISVDKILVKNEDGSAFLSIFYYNDGENTAWYDADFNERSDYPVIYLDSFYVQRTTGSDIDLVTSGEVKTQNTGLLLLPGYNFVGGTYPVGATLASSTLSTFLSPSTDGSTDTTDTVLLPQEDGGYLTYFYYNDGSFATWYDASFNESNDVAITSGLVIQNKGITKSATLAIPSSYATL